MAFIQLIALLAIVVAAGAPAWAKDIVVGDDSGWKLTLITKIGLRGKSFALVTSLYFCDVVFKYKKGAHNVIRVDGDGFKYCAQPENSEPLATGNDVITLSGPGKKWYICGVGAHCENGMKLVINVASQEGSSDSASSNSAADIAPRFLAWMIAAFSFFAFIMV